LPVVDGEGAEFEKMKPSPVTGEAVCRSSDRPFKKRFQTELAVGGVQFGRYLRGTVEAQPAITEDAPRCALQSSNGESLGGVFICFEAERASLGDGRIVGNRSIILHSAFHSHSKAGQPATA